MGWEKRERGGSYYYKKERQGSRVRSVYVGGGVTALLISRHEELERAQAKLRRDLELAARAGCEAIDEEIARHAELTDTLTQAALLAAGFHTHKRQWRRKRNGRRVDNHVEG